MRRRESRRGFQRRSGLPAPAGAVRAGEPESRAPTHGSAMGSGCMVDVLGRVGWSPLDPRSQPDVASRGLVVPCSASTLATLSAFVIRTPRLSFAFDAFPNASRYVPAFTRHWTLLRPSWRAARSDGLRVEAELQQAQDRRGHHQHKHSHRERVNHRSILPGCQWRQPHYHASCEGVTRRCSEVGR
jgi:hypothetical protein